MLRLIPLVSRRWQCIRSSYLAQPSVGRRLDRCCRLEPFAGGYPDVANTRLFDDCNIRGRRSLTPTQKATFSEVYKTHGKLKEQFQRTMRTCELVEIVNFVNLNIQAKYGCSDQSSGQLNPFPSFVLLC